MTQKPKSDLNFEEPSVIQAWIHHIDKILEIASTIPELNVGGKFLNKLEVRSLMDNKKGVFLALSLHNELIGFVYGYAETPDCACLMYLCVMEQYRDRGYGKTLYKAFHDCIIQLGVRKIY